MSIKKASVLLGLVIPAFIAIEIVAQGLVSFFSLVFTNDAPRWIFPNGEVATWTLGITACVLLGPTVSLIRELKKIIEWERILKERVLKNIQQ